MTSPDSGAHWTLPFKINKTTGSFFFPWLAAGSAGIVDASYYSSTTLQPNNPSSIWYAGFSQITGARAAYTGGANATYSSTPVATDEILLNSSVIHGNGSTGGGICTFGIFCSAVPGANRGLADVFEVHVDPAGGANVTWTKDLNGKFIQFGCQNSGASAFAGAPDLNGCYGPADMSIAKSDTPDPVGAGQNLTYHLTVTNNGMASGPSTTSGVTVTDTLPQGVTLLSKTPSTGSCSGTTTITCSLGIFPGGASATIDLVVTVSPSASNGTTLTNTATVKAVTSDPNSANDTATASTTVVNGADLSLTKSDSPDPVHTGQTLTYRLTVHNAGPFAAANVSVTDQLPRNTAFGTAGATQGTCALTQPTKRIVTCSLGTMASGSTVTATIMVTPPSKKTTITNTASASSTTNDPNTANNSDSATTSVVP